MSLSLKKRNLIFSHIQLFKYEFIKMFPISSQPSVHNYNLAAICIQKHVRGWLIRRSFLPRSWFSLYKPTCEAVLSGRISLPRATAGRTRVYLPKTLPVVLKYIDSSSKMYLRAQNTELVRSVLRARHVNNLVIPRTRRYKKFLVEERLAVDTDIIHNMGLYLSHYTQFNQAVQEFVELFQVLEFKDFVTEKQKAPISRLTTDFVRYDNIPLFLSKEDNGRTIGKVALIDLEDASPGRTSIDILVRIFPLHKELIMQKAYQLGIFFNTELCNQAEDRGIESLNKGFAYYATWLEQRKVLFKPGQHCIPTSAVAIAEMTASLAKSILDFHFGIEVHNAHEQNQAFLTGKPYERSRELAKHLTQQFLANIRECTDEVIVPSDTPILKAVVIRSETIARKALLCNIDKTLLKKKYTRLSEYSNPSLAADRLAEKLLTTFMQNLVSKDYIFDYDPAHYTGCVNLCWLRH